MQGHIVTVTDENGCVYTSTNNVCFGDKNADISITVTGGTKDYTFLWTTTDGSGLDSDSEDQTDPSRNI